MTVVAYEYMGEVLYREMNLPASKPDPDEPEDWDWDSEEDPEPEEDERYHDERYGYL